MNSFLKSDISLQKIALDLECKFQGNAEKKITFIGDVNYVLRGLSIFNENTIYYVETEHIAKSINSKAFKGVVLTSRDLAHYFPDCVITDKNPKIAFIELLEYFQNMCPEEINVSGFIHEGARISSKSHIAYGATIGNHVTIEENCVIQANAVIEPYAVIKKGSKIYSGVHVGHHCIIGENNIIYPNAVIGSDGFGYFDVKNTRFKIPQIGNVELGKGVEIGSCTTIDRSTIESTIVGDNTKIDNLVQIAHNCLIGKYVYIAGKASMAGSVTIEDGAILAGGCGIKDHVKIAQNSIILAFTGIEEDTEPGQTYFGIPARKVRDMHRINAALNQLPEIIKKFKQNSEH